MGLDKPFRLEILLAGSLLVVSTILLVVGLFRLTIPEFNAGLTELMPTDFLGEAIGLLVVVAFSYPVGLVLDILSVSVADRLGRDKFLRGSADLVPACIHSTLEEIFATAKSQYGSRLRFEEGDWLPYVRIALNHKSPDLYQRVQETYGAATDVARLFMLACGAAVVPLIILAAITVLREDGLTLPVGLVVTAVAGLGITSVVNWLVYKRLAWKEARSLLIRFSIAYSIRLREVQSECATCSATSCRQDYETAG